MTFEEKLQRLEQIIQQMDSDQANLDEALELYEQGSALLSQCQKHLTSVRGKIELIRDGESQGEYTQENFPREST